MISVEELQKIQKESEITAEENLNNHIRLREKDLELIFIDAAKQGMSCATIGFPKTINNYEYAKNEMLRLLKKRFDTFRVTEEYTGLENYYFSFSWLLIKRKEDV